MTKLIPTKMTWWQREKVFIHFIWCYIINWNLGSVFWPNREWEEYKSDRHHVVRCSCGYGSKFHPMAYKNDDFKFHNNISHDHLGLFQSPIVSAREEWPNIGYDKSVKDIKQKTETSTYKIRLVPILAKTYKKDDIPELQNIEIIKETKK